MRSVFSHNFLEEMYIKNNKSKKNLYLQKQLNKIRKPVINKLIKQNPKNFEQ